MPKEKTFVILTMKGRYMKLCETDLNHQQDLYQKAAAETPVALWEWCFEGGEPPEWLYDWAYDNGLSFMDTEDADNWLCDRVQWVIDEFGLDENEKPRRFKELDD